MKQSLSWNLTDTVKLLQLIVLAGIILYVGKTLFIPLSFAVLISFVLYPLCKWLERKSIPRALAITISIVLLTIVLAAIIILLISQIQEFLREWPFLRIKLMLMVSELSAFVSNTLSIPVKDQAGWLQGLVADSLPQLLPMLKQLIYSSAVGLVFLILIPFFIALILYNRERLTDSVSALIPATDKKMIVETLRETVTTFYSFIKGMLLVYIIVAILNIVALLLIGIPHAVLFGILISLLTIIPYVGITVGSLLPLTMAWLSYDSIWYPVAVIAAFTFIQYLEANLIFPLAVSYRLNVNTLFMILAIIAGGLLWGTAGMILFVPFTAILKLIADKVESLKPIAILLGNGK